MAQSNGDKVYDFHQRIGSPPPGQSEVPAADMIQLRQTLIDEEYAEVSAAFADVLAAQTAGKRVDIAPLIHELVDLLYVAYGAIWTFGVDPDPVFAEVHRANLQKASAPRRADGKVLKPADWQPADVARVIARLQGEGL